MKWFRTHIRHGAKLALLALAVQFVLSFGHVHLDQVHAAPAGAAIAAVQAPATPDADHHNHGALDPCAICAVIAMASTALFSAPPIVRLPQAADLVYQAAKAEFDHMGAISGASQPRGPPAS